ncbi:MAG: PAS domain S-box protein [Alphaproteobacteria bacterium]
MGKKNPTKKAGNVWLTSGLAQAMVMMNGLIITVTAFLVFSYFISGMSTEEYKRTSSEAGRALVESISSVENTMRLIANIIELSENDDKNTLVDRIRQNISDLEHFDQLLWLYEESTGVWKYRTISQNSGDLVASAQYRLIPDQTFINRLVRDGVFKDEELRISSAFKGMDYLKENENPVTLSRSFAFLKAVQRNAFSKGVIIGVSRAALLFDQDLISEEKSLLRISIHDKETDRRLFHMSRIANEEEKSKNQHLQQTYSFYIADRQWDIVMEFTKKQNVLLLEKLPYIVLFFGLVLTFIGTLFVRNNNQQAQKLAQINRRLEQKNYELQSEISERSRLNDALALAEKDNRAIINAVRDIIFETDMEGTVLFLNAAWRQITDFEIERSRGSNLFSMLHPQDQQKQRRDFDMLVRGQKQAYRSFTRLRTSDGTFRAVELAVSMIRQDENNNMRVVGTITDVEERRRAERALAEAEKKYRAIVENAAGGLYQLTPEGMYLSANPAMARILGYDSPEEMLRLIKNANGMVYPNKKEREDFAKTLVNQEQVIGYESQVLRKDGNKIWVRENIRVVKDDQQNVIYFEGSMEDITKRKEADFALMEAKIQSDMASRAKSEFIANMSHELRTPLNSIIGFSDIMQKEVMGQLGQDVYKEYAADINRSGKGLLKTINEILDISKIEAGNRDLSESEFTFSDVVQTCTELYFSRQKEKKITLVNHCKNMPSIVGEELSIKQVIGNVYSNAIKYTPSGGRITIVSNYDLDGTFRFSITDTGIGMTAEEIETALSPFGQLNNALDRSSSGVGLGLSLSKAIMDIHEGRIEIISEKSIGTTVTLIFPPQRVIRHSEEQDERRTKTDITETGDNEKV